MRFLPRFQLISLLEFKIAGSESKFFVSPLTKITLALFLYIKLCCELAAFYLMFEVCKSLASRHLGDGLVFGVFFRRDDLR